MIETHFTEELQKIIEKISNNESAEKDFDEYLEKICKIKEQKFTPTFWPQKWRRKVYEFGQLFINRDGGTYISSVKKYIGDGETCEIAAFLYSEISWNHYDQIPEYLRDDLRSFISEFPHNPEFHNTYGMFLVQNGSFDKSISEHKLAVLADTEYFVFINNYFLAVKQYFEHALYKKQPNLAQAILDDAETFFIEKGINKIRIIGWEMMTKLNALKDRLNDYLITEGLVDTFKREIENKIRSEQKTLIEVLGVFSAITAFILTNITIALSSLSVTEALLLMLAMSLVLIIFSITISLLFSARSRYQPRNFYLKDLRFKLILFFVILLGGIVTFSYYLLPDETKPNEANEVGNIANSTPTEWTATTTEESGTSSLPTE